MTDNGYAADRLSPARHVASELDRAAPSALSLAELTATYRHPNTGDLARIARHEHTDDPAAWLVSGAIEALTRNGEHGRVQIECLGDGFRLADGLSFGDLRFERKQLAKLHDDHVQFRAPFDPMTGRFAENIRTDKVAASKDGMEELRESMRALGWVPEFPALRDKRGVVLTGHRRIKVAAELGIEPVYGDLDIGDGDEHDARRLRIALASNLGFKPMSPTDRKAIAESLYSDNWTMARIGEALNVSVGTVHKDLDGFSPAEKPDRPKGGRPRGGSKRQAEQVELDRKVADGLAAGKTQSEIGRELGIGDNSMRLAKAAGRYDAGPVLEQMLGLMATLADLDTVTQIRQAADDRVAALGGKSWRGEGV